MGSKKSSRLEKKVAEEVIEGQQQINSGAIPFWPQDIKSKYWLIEHKYIEPWTKSYSLKRKYFSDITREAFKLNKSPVLVLEMLGHPYIKLAVIRFEDFIALDECIEKELNE